MMATAIQTTQSGSVKHVVRHDEETINEIAELVERSYHAFNELYEAGDFERFPWLQKNLSKVEVIADSYSPEKLHAWLSSLYKRYRSAKRGDAVRS